ncbi:hypothetical protein ACXJJ3_42055 (plasmid) [Kribbella sp. WER1]
MPTPDLTHGDTRNLFEAYSAMAYHLDQDDGRFSSLSYKSLLNSYANMIMLAIIAITRGAISVGWWLFSITDIKSVSDATTGIITAASGALTSWLLPAALALGAVIAYARQRGGRSGGGTSQVMWVVAAGVLAVSFTSGAGLWVNGIDSVRQVGATAVMDASTRAINTTDNTVPFEMPAPAYNTGNARDKLLRQSADATWRAFAATPWCLAEFGSLDACKRYGKAILDRGMDDDTRMKYIDGELKRMEGGGDAPTVKWTKGENPVGRLGILVLGFLAAVVFAALTITLAFAAAMAFIGALLMLVAGVFFACLWVIPGRPRQWGMNWFEILLGLVLQSVLALLVFGTALSLVTAVYSLAGNMGWLPVNGLALSVLFAAFRLRRMLESVTQMMRPGMASSGLMGALALRQTMKMLGGLSKFGRSRRRTTTSSTKPPRNPKPLPDPNPGPDGDDRIKPRPPRPSTPPPTSPQPSTPGGPQGTGPGGSRPGGGPGHLPGRTAEPPETPTAPGDEISAPRPRTIKVDPAAKDPRKVDVSDPDKISAAGSSRPIGGHTPGGPTGAGKGSAGSAAEATTEPADKSSERLSSGNVPRKVDAAPGRPSTEPKHTAPRAYRPGKATNRYESVRPSTPTLREGPPPPGARTPRPPRSQPRKFRTYHQTPAQVPPRSRPERIPERTR